MARGEEAVMATRRIREFLDGNHVKYVLISHSTAYTAQEVAESAHVPGRELAKSVIVRLDGRLAIAVVPATRDVEMALLRAETGAIYVGLAEEREFADRFEGCQLGAMPPFGNLFGMETVADRRLEEEDLIAFNAGSHTDVIAMRFVDWRRLVRPKVADISVPAGADFLKTGPV
jgi:Ala-tRNA(Pro) deacylase